jgi:6-phosphofructokinase 1
MRMTVRRVLPLLTPSKGEAPMSSGKVLVAQGGGPTAVINQSLVGVVLEARRFREVRRVYGARHGVRGIVGEDFVDLSQETSHNLELVAGTPSSALGSTRDKPDLAYCQEIFKVLQAHEIEHFFYIGGNDSSDTVRIVSEEAHKAGYPLRTLHIPKTIDNDLVGSDHTPGYPSAARFVAQAFAGANLDNAALPGVYVGVVMGRHAGFLTAASALGKKFPDDGPHLIYLPERVFELERFLADVKAMHARHGRCVIAVSEGIHDASGEPILAQLAKDLEHDAHGNVQLSGSGALADLLCEEIRSRLGLKRVRGDTFGYLQRSFIGCTSDVDQREAREVGEKAVQFAMWGDRDGSVAIKRTGFYSVDYELLPLAMVAGKTRTMEDHFIAENGTDITDAFRLYLRPLLGSGMPDAFRLRTHQVPKVLRP